jgi:hypothetical protein
MKSMRCAGRAFAVIALVAFPAAAAFADQVRITGQVASIHAKPDSSSQVLFVARGQQTFALVSNQGDWFEITTDQGLHGFVFHNLAEIVAPAGAAPAAGAGDSGGPSIDHKPIGCIVVGKYPKLDAGFDPADPARARIYFKAGGTVHWYYVEMKSEAGRYYGILPKPKKSIKNIDYYVSGLSKESLEGRTQDYSPDVVEKEDQCKGKPVPAYVPQANVLVGGGIPEGFEVAGLAGAAAAGATTAGVAASHATAILVGGGVVAAGAATAIVVHNNNNPTCTANGFTFDVTAGFTGSLACSQTNATQQIYKITNNTCANLNVTGLLVGYTFTGQCNNPDRTDTLELNGQTTIQPGQSATIRTGVPPGQARTFCCPTPPCASGTCQVAELFTVTTNAGTKTATNNFSVTTNNNCPACSVPHADALVVKKGGQATMCFEGNQGQ